MIIKATNTYTRSNIGTTRPFNEGHSQVGKRGYSSCVAPLFNVSCNTIARICARQRKPVDVTINNMPQYIYISLLSKKGCLMSIERYHTSELLCMVANKTLPPCVKSTNGKYLFPRWPFSFAVTSLVVHAISHGSLTSSTRFDQSNQLCGTMCSICNKSVAGFFVVGAAPE